LTLYSEIVFTHLMRTFANIFYTVTPLNSCITPQNTTKHATALEIVNTR